MELFLILISCGVMFALYIEKESLVARRDALLFVLQHKDVSQTLTRLVKESSSEDSARVLFNVYEFNQEVEKNIQSCPDLWYILKPLLVDVYYIRKECIS